MSKKDKNEVIDPNKKHYFSEVPRNDFTFIFKQMVDEKTEVLLWEKGKSETNVESFQVKEFKSNDHKLIIEPNGNLIKKFLSSNLTNKQVFFKCNLGKFQYFSTSPLEQDHKDKKKYFLSTNGNLFKSQQRANYRLDARENIKIQFRINESTLFNALDVSAGGTSFIVDNLHLHLYKKGNTFSKCKLGLNHHKFEIPKAIVVGHWPQYNSLNEPLEVTKIGIQFSDLPRETEEALFKSINQEARSDEIRKFISKNKKED